MDHFTQINGRSESVDLAKRQREIDIYTNKADRKHINLYYLISSMVIQLKALQETMSTGSMDITETFRTDDITKTDFFDFVTAPDTIGIGINDRVTSDTNGNNLDAPLQGFDQVITHAFIIHLLCYKFHASFFIEQTLFRLQHCLFSIKLII